MHIYTYNTDIGTFEIREVQHKMYELWIDEELLGDYESAEFAAQDVANFDTGYIEWDEYENEIENFPADLSKWKEVKEESPE
ncbi:MAG: hypothetical protein PHE73_05610 [Sulfurovaceae bacterium]|nr:hypothetical protein [Sulfurovaceae bacterium]